MKLEAAGILACLVVGGCASDYVPADPVDQAQYDPDVAECEDVAAETNLPGATMLAFLGGAVWGAGHGRGPCRHSRERGN
jgi:hypothetical protein